MRSLRFDFARSERDQSEGNQRQEPSPPAASKLTFAARTSGVLSSRCQSNCPSVFSFGIDSQYNPAERERPSLPTWGDKSMEPGTALGLAGLGFTALSVSAYRLFPKVPKWIDVVGFLIGIGLIGAAIIGSWLRMFAGHRLEWVVQKGVPLSIMNGGGWPSALVFAAVVFAAAWMSIQFALRAMSGQTIQRQQPQDPQWSGRSAEQILLNLYLA
jgi:hypothetical protein